MIQVNKFKCLLVLLAMLTSSLVFSQNKKITKDDLKLELANFLVQKRIIENIDVYESDKSIVKLQGLYQNKVKEDLILGMYSFSVNRTHNQAFFVLVNDDASYEVLDLTNREELIKSINKTLLFCEENDFCSEIIRDYINRIIGVYYNINLHPNTRRDPNCEKGINDISKLP